MFFASLCAFFVSIICRFACATVSSQLCRRHHDPQIGNRSGTFSDHKKQLQIRRYRQVWGGAIFTLSTTPSHILSINLAPFSYELAFKIASRRQPWCIQKQKQKEKWEERVLSDKKRHSCFPTRNKEIRSCTTEFETWEGFIVWPLRWCQQGAQIQQRLYQK